MKSRLLLTLVFLSGSAFAKDLVLYGQYQAATEISERILSSSETIAALGPEGGLFAGDFLKLGGKEPKTDNTCTISVHRYRMGEIFVYRYLVSVLKWGATYTEFVDFSSAEVGNPEALPRLVNLISLKGDKLVIANGRFDGNHNYIADKTLILRLKEGGSEIDSARIVVMERGYKSLGEYRCVLQN